MFIVYTSELNYYIFKVYKCEISLIKYRYKTFQLISNSALVQLFFSLDTWNERGNYKGDYYRKTKMGGMLCSHLGKYQNDSFCFIFPPKYMCYS